MVSLFVVEGRDFGRAGSGPLQSSSFGPWSSFFSCLWTLLQIRLATTRPASSDASFLPNKFHKKSMQKGKAESVTFLVASLGVAVCEELFIGSSMIIFYLFTTMGHYYW